MEIELKDRFIQVLSRSIKFNRKEIEEELNNHNNDGGFQYNEKIKVNFTFYSKQHSEDCEEYDEDSDNYITGECKECGSEDIQYRCIIHYDDNYITTVKWNKTTTLSHLMEMLLDLSGEKYQVCKCGNTGKLLQYDGMCKTCFIWSYTRTEEEGGDCSICYENNGRWVELKTCKHQFHYGCIKKYNNKKCPLCRHEYITHCDFTMDPYDK
jgi:hypothetical protein